MGRIATRVPSFRIDRYAPGEQPAQFTPGDFLLTHAKSWTSSLIRFGEAIRYWGARRKFAHWSHAALIADASGNIIEALGNGVQLRNISVYRDTEYHLVHLTEVLPSAPSETEQAERANAVAFAQHCLQDHYGFLTLLSLAVTLLTGSRFFFGVDGQMICSGLVARALERMGAIFPYDSWHMMPADLAEQFNVVPTPGAAIGNPPRPEAERKARSR
jgi:hypothetical protein